MKSITAAQHQQHTIQFQSFLWEWKDWIECVCWAGCGTKANSNSGGIADCLPRRVWLMECLSPRLLFEWVRGGCRPQRSARRSKRRERERHEFNQTKATQPIEQSEIEWSWRIERECRWSKPIQKINSLSEEKWIYCWMALPAPSNGAPSSNSCAASPTTLSFFCRPAEAPSKRKKRVDWLGCLALPSTNERFSICWMEWAAGEEKKSIKWSWKGLVEFNPAPLIDFSSFNQLFLLFEKHFNSFNSAKRQRKAKERKTKFINLHSLQWMKEIDWICWFFFPARNQSNQMKMFHWFVEEARQAATQKKFKFLLMEAALRNFTIHHQSINHQSN